MNTIEQNCTLTAREERLIAALLTAPTIEAAAKRAGVARGTAYNWLGNQQFKAALVHRQSEVFTEALRGLKSAMGAAVNRLVALVGSQDDRIALMAAKEILAHGLRAHESVEIEERLTALEARLAAATGER